MKTNLRINIELCYSLASRSADLYLHTIQYKFSQAMFKLIASSAINNASDVRLDI